MMFFEKQIHDSSILLIITMKIAKTKTAEKIAQFTVNKIHVS